MLLLSQYHVYYPSTKFILPKYYVHTIPVQRLYYPSTTSLLYQYNGTTSLLSQYYAYRYYQVYTIPVHVLLSQYHVPTIPVPRSTIPVPRSFYLSTTFILSQYHVPTIPTKQIWPAFVSNSIVGLESLPFY